MIALSDQARPALLRELDFLSRIFLAIERPYVLIRCRFSIQSTSSTPINVALPTTLRAVCVYVDPLQRYARYCNR